MIDEEKAATELATRLNRMTPQQREEFVDELRFSLAFCWSCFQDMEAGQFICHCDNDE